MSSIPIAAKGAAKPKPTSPQDFAFELSSISIAQLIHQIGIDRIQGGAHAVLVSEKVLSIKARKPY